MWGLLTFLGETIQARRQIRKIEEEGELWEPEKYVVHRDVKGANPY